MGWLALAKRSSKKRLQSVAERQRSEQASFLDERPDWLGQVRAWIDDREVRVRGKEGIHHFIVLFRFARARRVDQATSGADGCRGAIEQLALACRERGQIRFSS